MGTSCDTLPIVSSAYFAAKYPYSFIKEFIMTYKKITSSLPLLSLLPLAVATQLQAGEFNVGIGAYYSKPVYQDFKDNSGAFPLIEYQGEGWSVGAQGINVDVYNTEQSPLSISLELSSLGQGYSASDSQIFNGMQKRKASVDLGVNVAYQVGQGSFNSSLMSDVSSTHKGYVLDINYQHNLPLMGGMFQPSVGLSAHSDNFNNYYYGVRASEVTGNRAAYQAKSSVNPYIGYQFLYPINDNFNLAHGTSYTVLDSEIKNSPLVDRDNSWSTFVGASYSF